MIHFATGLLAIAGFVLLLMAMERHQKDWLRRKLAPRLGRLLRGAGVTALAVAFLAAGTGLGWAYGTVAWCGWLSVGAALTLAAHTNRERILARLQR